MFMRLSVDTDIRRVKAGKFPMYGTAQKRGLHKVILK